MDYNRYLLKYLTPSLLLILFSSCNIYSFSGASIDERTKTMHVKYIDNKATLISPNLSNNLTETLKTKCLNETNLSWDEESPDIEFSGFITHYKIEPVAIQNNETAAKNRLTINVNIIYINKIDVSQNFNKVFSHYTDFDSNQNFSEKEEELNNTIVNNLIEDIFNTALVNW